MLASPEVKQLEPKALPKTVIFVLDRSGSMAGKKLDQARNALQFVLNNLRDDDTFNIIAYDDRVEAFKPELQRYSSSSRVDAEKFVSNIREGGSTNIDGALKAALAMISDDTRPNYVLFLTDGLPTASETNELRIAENARERRTSTTRFEVFSFGVGFDVNARLLDRLSGGNGGTSEYVRPDEDIESHVGAFYSKMTRPAFAAISVTMAGTDVNRTYPRDVPDLFEGGQLVWVGRYQKSGKATVKLAGKVGGEARSFEFPAELASPGTNTGYDFVEKLWAVRRVGFIIDQIDLNGQNKELIDELVALSTRYGLLTPYTSFLADERVNLHAMWQNQNRTKFNLDALQVVQGEAGVEQRRMKQAYNQEQLFEEDLVATYRGSIDAEDQKSARMMGMGGMGGAGGGTMANPRPQVAGRHGPGRGISQARTPAAKPGATPLYAGQPSPAPIQRAIPQSPSSKKAASRRSAWLSSGRAMMKGSARSPSVNAESVDMPIRRSSRGSRLPASGTSAPRRSTARATAGSTPPSSPRKMPRRSSSNSSARSSSSSPATCRPTRTSTSPSRSPSPCSSPARSTGSSRRRLRQSSG